MKLDEFLDENNNCYLQLEEKLSEKIIIVDNYKIEEEKLEIPVREEINDGPVRQEPN